MPAYRGVVRTGPESSVLYLQMIAPSDDFAVTAMLAFVKARARTCANFGWNLEMVYRVDNAAVVVWQPVAIA